MSNTDHTSSPLSEAPVKAAFIPKRRTPYLMQNEVIKNKNETELLQQKDSLNEYGGSIKPSNTPLDVGSQLVVNKRSVSSQNNEVIKQKTLNPKTAPLLAVNKELESFSPALTINYHEEVGRLYGIQKKLAHFFVQSCIQRNQNKTGPVTAETLCLVTGSTKKTIKKIIQRMIEKQIISRTEGKRGKGGFATYVLDSAFINVVRLQLDIELDHVAINSKFSAAHAAPLPKREFPEAWDRIDLTSLIAAFNTTKTKSSQFFGKAQLKAIYAAETKLSADEVQQSILAFAYGLSHYASEEPYINMLNPAAILFETLKNGDKWEEKKFLTTEEDFIYKIYLNLLKKYNEEIRMHYQKWMEMDKKEKFEYYRKRMGSTQFYNDRVFEEKAWEDYEKNIWPKSRDLMILDVIGINNKSIIDKVKLLVVN